eukprot:gene13617-biopygen12562
MRCDPNMYGPVLSRQLSMGRMDRALKRRHVERPSVAETESHSLCPQPTGQTGEYKTALPEGDCLLFSRLTHRWIARSPMRAPPPAPPHPARAAATPTAPFPGFAAAAAVLAPAECDALGSALMLNLEQRGARRLRWYGMRWAGRGCISPAPPIPDACAGLVTRVCELMDFPAANVATVHVYRRSLAQRAGRSCGGFAGRLLAIAPHSDDPALEGAGGVLTLTLAGCAELALLRHGRCVGSAVRPVGAACVLKGAAFAAPVQHAVVWPEEG